MIPQQNTPEWLEYRRSRIGASDASAIMGESTWTSAFELWQRKLGIIPEKEQNDAMKRGIALEAVARDKLEQKFGCKFEPLVIENSKREWQIASLDAWCRHLRMAIEIKCPGAKDHATALSGKVPDHYYAQLMHQCSTCELDRVYYYSFDGENGVLLEVLRDDAYIEKLLAKELEFLECMRSFVAPPLTDRDYINLEGDEEWVRLTNEYKRIKLMMSSYTDLEKKLRSSLEDKCKNRSCYGNGVNLTRVTKKGTLPLLEISQLAGVDLSKWEHMRSPPTVFTRITEDKT